MPVAFQSQQVISGLSNPTSLQFGPDGRLYVSQQDGLIRIYDVTQPAAGQWDAVEVGTIDAIKNIPNHDDDGSLNAALADRQVTGLLVAGTAANPVLYVASSDPRISVFSDVNLDTNSSILSKLTWNGAEWEKVDLIRGLPRSEENHSPNGMVLSADGTKLYLTQGGNTNNGAPSLYFSNTPEYALAAAVLEIDLTALAALPDKTFTYAPGVTSTYKYDLPTLDDPTVANNGASGNESSAGLDVGGPFGGNDGLNQAVLPADAPFRIYATGLRNAYDVVLTQAGKLFTVDNGGNTDLGSVPILDANGKPTNLVNNGGTGTGDFLYLLSDGGYFGHPDPTRGNQTGSIFSYSDGANPQVIASIPNAADAVPDGVDIAPGFVIDPSKFTSSAARLAQEGEFAGGQKGLAQFGASTNGLMEYTASAFDGEITGDLITASFDGTIKLIHLAADGTTVVDVTTLATPGGTPLDLVQGPDGSIWVAQIGSGQVTVLTPTDQPVVTDPDIDDDGLANAVDPFQADAANGFGTFLTKNASLDWNLQFGAGNSAPGPTGLFLGLTGHVINGSRDFVAPVEAGGLDLTNVKIGTAAGGGLLVVENVSTGTASGSFNTGEFVFQTGVAVAQDVESFDIEWTAVNPFPGLAASPATRQIGGFIGTGDQSNFLKVVAGPSGSGNLQFELESNDVVVASQTLNAAGLLNAPVDSSLVFNLAVNRATAQATPSVTFAGSSGPITVTGTAISLAGTSILSAIDGDYTVQGEASGLAVGLWSSNTGEGSQDTFQATFDDITITSTGPAGQPVKAVNVGGGQVTAGNGVVFEADPGPTTGAAASQTFATTAAISGTTDDALFQDERWTPGGSYTYEVPVANGTYRVDLLLAEIFSGITGAGQRVFDMAIEGQALAALQNIDVFAQVGANTALTISQQVTVSDGSLSIQVGPGSSAAGNVENAKLNAFAIYPVGAAPSATLSIDAVNASKDEGNSGSTAFSFGVTRTGDTSGSSTASYAVTGSGSAPANAADFAGGVLPAGTVSFAAGETAKTITVNVAGDTTVEPTEGFSVTLSSPGAGTTIGTASATGSILDDDGGGGTDQLIKAVNVGGGQVTAGNGIVFEADSGPTTGAAESKTFATTAAIAGTTDDALYQDERWTPGGSYTYEVPVANGTYKVDLLLAEIYSGITGAGQRVFDMAIEGQALPALQNIDVFAQVGANAALTISQEVTVSDGALSIEVGPGSAAAGNVENAKLNAFAVFAAGAPPSATLSIAAANASLNEGNSASTAFSFTVTRTGDTSGSSTASYAVTGGGSAPANAADFAGGVLPTGTVSFAAGETAKTITVNVAGDTTVEPTEGFNVTLSSPGAGTTIGTASATGSILDDDGGGGTGQLIKAVNVGGGQVTAGNGVVFEADAGPATGAAESKTFATTAAISGTTDDALYQDERWTPGGSYTYEVPVANGTYKVDLLLAEIYFGITGPGQRVFDMALEGQAVPALQNIDVFGQVGANAALTLSQQVTVSDGSLSIQVGPGSAAPGNVENAKLNAFAVFAAAAPPSATLSIAAASASLNEGNSASTTFSFTVTRTGDTSASSTASYAVAGSGSAPANAADFTGGALPTGTVSFAAGETAKTITVNVAGDTTVEPTETFAVTLSSPGAGTTIGTASATGSILDDDGGGTGQLIKAVNVGGGQVTAGNGVVFEADAGPTTGAAESKTFATTAAISGTTDDALYQDERWTPGGSYTYEVPVANGTYKVDLLLAEIYFGITGPGQRVFDMAIEGQAVPALQNIDVFAQVGANAALTLSQQVAVNDGSLSIQVGPGSAAAGNVENAKLNAFAVFAAGAPPSATLSIAAANASLNEGNSASTAFSFTVTRTGDTSGSSTASYAVTGSGSAPASAADFTGGALPTGTVSFAAGETAKTITVNVAGDTTVEPTEGFNVTLSSPGAGTTIGTASATGSILNDDSSGGGSPAARLMITPGTPVNASTFNEPSYELTNLGTTNIRTLSIDLQGSLVAGTVFDPFGTFGDTTALDLTPYGSNPVGATWAYGPNPVTEGGFRTLDVTFGGAGLAPGQAFNFRLDADPASISGPSPGPNEAGSISGFEHVGAKATIGLVDGTSQSAEIFTQGSAGGGMATLAPGLQPQPTLAISDAAGVPLATDEVGGILQANLAGLEAGAGSPGNDVIVTITGTPGEVVRLAVSELGGLGMDIPLGSHEGNTVLQAPLFIDATIDANGVANVPIALPAETPTATLESGSVSGLFAFTAATVDPATGAATSLVSTTLVVKDAPAALTSDPANANAFVFQEGFGTTDVHGFTATGANDDVIALDQDLFPGMTVQEFLASGALSPGAGPGDVDITTPSGSLIRLHDSSGELTVPLLQAHPEDFRFF